MNPWWWPFVPVLCLWIDRCFGEPSARWHPVAWMGHYLQWAGRRVAPVWPQASRPVPEKALAMSGEAGTHVHGEAPVSPTADEWQAFFKGATAWLVGAVMVWCLADVLQWFCLSMPSWFGLPGWLSLLLLALALKPMLAWAMLRDEVKAVEAALAQSLAAGRERLRWLVSRDTQALSEGDVREAAIETLAENLNDSVVAPLFWFALLGLPGAALYRFANTADAMWGYPGERDGRQWQWAGKWAARADDVLSWVPARLTALLLMLGAAAVRWQRLPAQARLTPSPNGGWPMAAMALRLGIRLGKPGVYVLNEAGRTPEAADTARALHRAARAVWLAGALAAVYLLWRM